MKIGRNQADVQCKSTHMVGKREHTELGMLIHRMISSTGFGGKKPSAMNKNRESSKILRRDWDKHWVSQAIGNDGLSQFI